MTKFKLGEVIEVTCLEEEWNGSSTSVIPQTETLVISEVKEVLNSNPEYSASKLDDLGASKKLYLSAVGGVSAKRTTKYTLKNIQDVLDQESSLNSLIGELSDHLGDESQQIFSHAARRAQDFATSLQAFLTILKDEKD